MPHKIGKYEIKATLGEGAMGIVYQGYDPDIERRVAIKILHPKLIDDIHSEELLERFKREAISAAKCIHPNIVTVLEYGQNDGMPYIVMEYVEGVSLQQVLKHRRSIDLKSIISIIAQLLKGLHAAHRLDIVHRDVKAANVMILKGDGRVKLADFGMARIAERPDLTMIGSIVGTPQYMAPEQMLGQEVDARADIFSVARLFVELLGLLPEDSPIPRSPLPTIVNLPPNNRFDYSIPYPSALIPVLQKGLSVCQEERFQSVAEFAQAINDALPRLKTGLSTSGQSAKTTAKPVTATEDEMISMTSLLTGFVGPIASVIMRDYETQGSSANDLATDISREIPEPGQQQEFLKRWELISASRRAASSGQKPEASAKKTSRRIDKVVLEKLGLDFASYIGPIASELLQHYTTRTNDLDQLVTYLGQEIPDRKDSQKFIKSWLRH